MRIAIANDLKLAVEVLLRIVKSKPQFTVAWIAYNGTEAIEKTKQDPPDLILMDLLMPQKSGEEATKEIMQTCPCPILIVSACVDSCMNMVFETMGAGALDVVSTPFLDELGNIVGADELIRKIDAIGHLTKKTIKKSVPTQLQSTSNIELKPRPRLLLFGASMGGPTTLVKLLKKLQLPQEVAIIIVQHVDSAFLPGFVKWLKDNVALPFLIAEKGEAPEPGKVYVADTKNHLKINERYKFDYVTDETQAYTPSVNTLFESIAKVWPSKGVATLLTGMGSDGAVGLLALKNKGWLTLSQNEETSVVYGMPKKAKELQASKECASLDEMAEIINKSFKKERAST